MPDLAQELLIVLAMMAGTVAAHLTGLAGLTQLTRLHIEHLRTPWLALDRQLVPLTMVMGLVLLHAAEVFAYAAVYHGVGAATDWEEALFLSAGAYSTAGWESVTTPPAWRVVVAFEALNGILLVGWSTAFLFQSLHRILQTEESHPLPEGAMVEDAAEELQEAAADAGMDSPRPSGSGRGAP